MNLDDVKPGVMRPGVAVIDREKEEIRTKQPPMYNIILNNDDYVAGEAVMGALQETFGMDNQRALQIMLHAHRAGKAIVATFAKDIAETKAGKAMDWVKKFHADLGVDGGVSQYLFTTEPAA